MRTRVVVVALMMVLTAGTVPAVGAGIVYRSSDGACQVTLPADWTIRDADAVDPGHKLIVSVMHQPDATVGEHSDAELIALFGAGTIHENSRQRLFFESSAGGSLRKWEAEVAAGTKGACEVIVFLKAGASDEVAQGIVKSLGPSP